MNWTLAVYGERTLIDADGPNMPLLYPLRNDLGLHGRAPSGAVSERRSPR